jgi:hypothetical protein
MHCPNCGSESSTSARFCRQCGAALFAEGDNTEVLRRSYAGPNASPSVATADSAPLPPSVADMFAGDTMRYPQPPSAPPTYAPPQYPAPSVPTVSLKKKRRGLLKVGALVLALLVAGGIGAAINESAQDGRVELSPAERARLELMRREDGLNRSVVGVVAEQRERMREDIERRMEEVRRAREEAERAAERGGAMATGEQPVDLSGFEYPGATSGQYSRVPGREMLTQVTGDSFETITQHYRQKLGPPLVQVVGRNDKQALFQSADAPPVAVLVREARGRGRQWEIVVLRSPFRFPVAQPPLPPPAPEAPPPPPAPDAKKSEDAPRAKAAQ